MFQQSPRPLQFPPWTLGANFTFQRLPAVCARCDPLCVLTSYTNLLRSLSIEAVLNHKYMHGIFLPTLDTLYKSVSIFFHTIEEFNYTALDAQIQTNV